MKSALKIGFKIAIDNWYTIIKTSSLFLLTCILLTLIESILVYELLGQITWTSYSYSMSFLDIDSIADLEDYFNGLFRGVFGALITLNSFFVGTYLHETGFPKIEERKEVKMDHVLDVPLTLTKKTITELLQYIQSADLRNYLKCLSFLLLLGFVGEMIGSALNQVGAFIYYIFMWLKTRVAYFLLFFMCCKWQKVSNRTFSLSKNTIGLLFILFVISSIEGYIYWNIRTAIAYDLGNLISVNSDMLYGLFSSTLLVFFALLLLPFISVFYTQTIIALKNDEAP